MTEEAYTPPKRLMIVNRRIQTEENREHLRFHHGKIDATIVENAAEEEITVMRKA